MRLPSVREAVVVICLLLLILLSLVTFRTERSTRDLSRKQTATLNLLCNRTYNLVPIVDDVVLGLIATVEERLAVDVALGDTKGVRSDLRSLHRLQGNHLLLQDLLLTRGTPCRKTP
jgi:hypothetical protein